MSRISSWQSRLCSGETLTLRSADPEDAEALLKITRAVIEEGEFVVTDPSEFDLTVERERQWIEAHTADPNKLVLVGEVGGVVVAFLQLQNGIRKRLAHRGRLHMLVDKGWRGKGIGGLLMKAALEWAELNPQIRKVCLAVFSSNERAIALYKKFGFEEEGRRIKEVHLENGLFVDDILMYRFFEDPNDKPESPQAVSS